MENKNKFKKNPSLLIRGYRILKHGVLVVGEDGQKSYYCPVFGRQVPYGSGQMLKRAILTSILNNLNLDFSSVEYEYIEKDKKLTQKNVVSSCDPEDLDQLLGGYMNTDIKVGRTGPISFSAFTPVHPLLSGINKELIMHDRRMSDNSSIVLVKSEKDAKKSDKIQKFSFDEMKTMFDEDKMASASASQFVPDNKRATGLFSYDVELNLNEIFSISLREYKREINKDLEKKLVDKGWTYNSDKTRLNMPSDKIENIIESIADGILNWRLLTNKSRTLDGLSDCAMIVTDNAHNLQRGIMTQLEQDLNGKQSVKIVVDETLENFFFSPELSSIVEVQYKKEKDIEKAKDLIKLILTKHYENSSKD